jgi:hypothetical protein
MVTSNPNAHFLKLRDPRSRKGCLSKLHSAPDFWPYIRLPSIWLHGIRLHSTKPHKIRLFNISGINSDLFLPIRMAKPRPTNQGTT